MEAVLLALITIKGGWAAIADDWAVFGKTEDEAVTQFNLAKSKHEEILKRPIFSKKADVQNCPKPF
jgi:hypothetical protein